MNVKGVLYRKWHGDSIGNGGTDLKVQEGYRLGSIVRRDFALRYKQMQIPSRL